MDIWHIESFHVEEEWKNISQSCSMHFVYIPFTKDLFLKHSLIYSVLSNPKRSSVMPARIQLKVNKVNREIITQPPKLWLKTGKETYHHVFPFFPPVLLSNPSNDLYKAVCLAYSLLSQPPSPTRLLQFGPFPSAFRKYKQWKGRDWAFVRLAST